MFFSQFSSKEDQALYGENSLTEDSPIETRKMNVYKNP